MSASHHSSNADMTRRHRMWLVAGLALTAAIMAAHIWWYRFLCDDAYIAFRYARNLARGRGLVFNVGEPVEGYTSLLWVLQLAAGDLIGVPGEMFPHVLSLMYTVGALIVWALFIYRQPGTHRWAVICMVLFALSINRTWAVWATGGLETRCFTFLVLLLFYVLTRAAQVVVQAERRRWLGAVSCTLALATLARPDAQVFMPLVVVFWLLRRGTETADLLALTVPFVVVVGAEYAWRFLYYGAWLPNTYYAKVGDPWPEMGVRYLLAFMLEYAYYLIIPLVLLMWRRVASPLSRQIGLLAAACMSLHAAYYCYQVGGDIFEFRIFDWFVPLLAWMAAESVVVLASRQRAAAIAVGVVIVAYSLVIPMSAALNTGQRPVADLAREALAPAAQFKVTVENTPIARWMPGMSSIIDLDRQLLGVLNMHFIALRQEHHRAIWLTFVQNIELARGVAERGILPPMTIGSPNIGVLGYYVDVPVIDLFGLTDAFVARRRTPGGFRLMAHERSAPVEYLEQRQAHVHIVSATRSPLPQRIVPPGRVVKRERRSYSIRLGDGVWLNIWSSDREWVRTYFTETAVDLIPHGLDSERR